MQSNDQMNCLFIMLIWTSYCTLYERNGTEPSHVHHIYVIQRSIIWVKANQNADPLEGFDPITWSIQISSQCGGTGEEWQIEVVWTFGK